MKKPAPMPDPREVPFVDVEQAAAILGVGRTVGYKLAASGELPTIRVGSLIRVPVAVLAKLAGQ